MKMIGPFQTTVSIAFWKILAVLHLFLAIIIRMLPRVQKFLGITYSERKVFEERNYSDVGCKSFFSHNQMASICFQCASEGEFEQIRWIAEDLLKRDHFVEVIFTSPSLENRIRKLFDLYPTHLRYLRTPLVTLSTIDLTHWITSPHVVMVRYDFYPMILSLCKEKTLSLIWFFRPRDKSGLFYDLKWRLILPTFSHIIASNGDDWWWLRERLSHKKLWSVPMDLRALSIYDRLQNSKIHLTKLFSDGFSKCFVPLLSNVASSIIHGNAYPNELKYLFDLNWKNAIKNKEIALCLVEHRTDSLKLERLKENYDMAFYEVSIGINESEMKKMCDTWHQHPGIWVFKGRGFLLELYSQFKISLVGGGFEGHTHSLLEPFLAGTRVYCGPKISRSSEYYQIKDINSQKLSSLATIEQWRSEVLSKILNGSISSDSGQTQDMKMNFDALKSNALLFLKSLGIQK